jgi:integrase
MPDFNPNSDTEIVLAKTRQDFLNYKYQTQKHTTARAYKYPTKSFLQYAKERDVTVPSEITKGLVNSWIDQRRNEVKPITVRNNAKHIRVYLKWLAQHDYTDWGIHLKIVIPDVPDRGDVNERIIAADRAEAILEYLSKYHYATTYHALFKTLWHTGCRISGAIALDVEDFQSDPYGDNALKFRNRPETDTPLKNKSSGERNVNISDELKTVLNDYINNPRHDVTDEYGRNPLFTTPNGRLYRQRSYKNIVALTRPCVIDDNCPHDREINECEAANDKEKSSMCPSSLPHHPIRKGAISYHLNNGWTKEVLSERVDVSGDVLEKHYDLRSEERKRENRAQYLHE